MSALAAVPTIDPIPTVPAGLTLEAQQELSSLAVSLRSHFTILQQTAVQIALITYRLIELIGDSGQAQAYFCQVTGKAPSTFRTYRSIGRVVSKHFTHPDGYIPMHIARLPLDAFSMIDESTDIRVIEAIDEHAQKGPLTAAQVRSVVDQQTANLRGELEASNERIVDLTASVAEAQAQAKDADDEKAKAIAAHDSMVVQLRAQEKVTEDLRGDRAAILNDLRESQEEIARLRAAETQVQFVDKVVEVMPKDVQSLGQVQNELAEATARYSRLQIELGGIEQRIADARDISETLDALEEKVGELIAAFPLVLVSKMHGSNPAVAMRTAAVADKLRALASTLSAEQPA